MSVCNDVDVLFIFNFHRDIKLNISEGHKRLVDLVEPSQLNLDNGASV